MMAALSTTRSQVTSSSLPMGGQTVSLPVTNMRFPSTLQGGGVVSHFSCRAKHWLHQKVTAIMQLQKFLQAMGLLLKILPVHRHLFTPDSMGPSGLLH